MTTHTTECRRPSASFHRTASSTASTPLKQQTVRRCLARDTFFSLQGWSIFVKYIYDCISYRYVSLGKIVILRRRLWFAGGRGFKAVHMDVYACILQKNRSLSCNGVSSHQFWCVLHSSEYGPRFAPAKGEISSITCQDAVVNVSLSLGHTVRHMYFNAQ